MDVISLEKGKVKIVENQVIKKSSEKELNNLLIAKKMIEDMEIDINNKCYKIKVPEVYDFKDNTIYMERLYGNNLELLLRDNSMHKNAVIYNNNFFKQLLLKKIFWKDFAPRNILFDDKSISIVDFERGFQNENCNLLNYFIDNVYEEYSAFMLPEERLYQFNKVFSIKQDYSILIDSIASKRIKQILSLLGYKKSVSISTYILAVKMIILNEEPFLKNGKIIFPIIELEDFISKNGHEKYAKKILRGYYEKTRNI